MLRRDEAACRQLANRARKHIEAGKPRFDPTGEEQSRIAAAFLAATGSGNTAQLAQLLAKDAVLISDGGGKVEAALNPILGSDQVIAFLLGVQKKVPFAGRDGIPASIINGLPGFMIVVPDGKVAQTLSFEIQDGVIHRIYAVRNPDKLKTLHA